MVKLILYIFTTREQVKVHRQQSCLIVFALFCFNRHFLPQDAINIFTTSYKYPKENLKISLLQNQYYHYINNIRTYFVIICFQIEIPIN